MLKNENAQSSNILKELSDLTKRKADVYIEL